MVAYRFEDSRSGDCAARHLDGYCGILQVDGYAAYKRLGKDRGANDVMTLAGCWASDGSLFAGAVVKAMAPLWAIEEDIRGHGAELRASIRAERSRPIVAELFTMLDRELPRLSGKSQLAEIIRYTLSRRTSFERFLADGRVKSTPTSSSAPSVRRPSPARMRSSLAPMAVVGPGPRSTLLNTILFMLIGT
jgi:transposase